jgi:hypothetical protein
VQGLPLKVPGPELLKLTVPVGVVGETDVSLTVAVQVVELFTGMLGGEQMTLVIVACLSAILVTKASNRPPKVVWKAPGVVGKLFEAVKPVT